MPKRSLFYPTPLAIFCAMLAVVAAAAPGRAQPPSTPRPTAGAKPFDECQVLARIGKQVVLSCELLWRVNLRLEKHRDKIPPGKIDEIRRMMLRQELNSLMDLKLLYADFRSRVPEVDLAAIHKNLEKPFQKERVPAMIKELKLGSPSELPARLQALGGSIEDLRQDYYQTTIARSWIRESVKVDGEVTHEEMLDYYQQHGGRYDYPAQVRWEELMARFSRFQDRDAAWAAIAAMGNEALTLAAQMPDRSQPAFDSVAKAKSHGFTAGEGGRHDWTTKGALVATNIDEALFTLPPGKMSPILKSDQGFHIVRVLERKTAGRTPFAEVQAEIKNRIRGKRYDDAVKAKIEQLRAGTQIWTVYTGATTAAAYLDSDGSGPLRR